MFRNNEGYPDPTAGTALAHIAYEERRKRKQVRHIKRKFARKKSSNRWQLIWIDFDNDQLHWIKAWPKEPEQTDNTNMR